MMIYLAHPIDQETTALEARDATQRLTAAGHVVFDPGTAWHIPSEVIPDASVQIANHAVINHCNLVVALLPAGVPTIGTIIEALATRQMHKRLVIVSTVRSWSMAWLEGHQVPDLDALMNWLEEGF